MTEDTTDFVFISYRHTGDKMVARSVARILKSLEIKTWLAEENLDKQFHGHQLPSKIDSIARKAKAMIVLWSEKSYRRDWVQAEAIVGQEENKLIGVVIDGLDPAKRITPTNIGKTYSINGWDFSGENENWNAILEQLEAILDRPSLTSLYALVSRSETSLERKEGWARKNPNDIYSGIFWSEIKKDKKENFTDRLKRLKQRKESFLTLCDKKFDEQIKRDETAFEGYLENLVGNDQLREPNPMAIWESNDVREQRKIITFLKDILKPGDDGDFNQMLLEKEALVKRIQDLNSDLTACGEVSKDLKIEKAENSKIKSKNEGLKVLIVKREDELALAQSKIEKTKNELQPLRKINSRKNLWKWLFWIVVLWIVFSANLTGIRNLIQA